MHIGRAGDAKYSTAREDVLKLTDFVENKILTSYLM